MKGQNKSYNVLFEDITGPCLPEVHLFLRSRKKKLQGRKTRKKEISGPTLDCSVNPKKSWGWGGGQIDPPSKFLAVNFCSLTDCQKLLHNCFLFVNTSFDTN